MTAGRRWRPDNPLGNARIAQGRCLQRLFYLRRRGMIIFRGRADVVRLIEIIRAQMRKKRQKALFSVLVGRAGLTRPWASPCGQRCALSSRFARLEPERRFSSSTTRRSMRSRSLQELRWRRCEKNAKRRFFLYWWVVQDSNLRPID